MNVLNVITVKEATEHVTVVYGRHVLVHVVTLPVTHKLFTQSNNLEKCGFPEYHWVSNRVIPGQNLR